MNQRPTSSVPGIPDHVPAELVFDFDYIDMQGETDVYRFWGKLHEGPDIFYSPRYGGHWVLTRQDDIGAVFENAADFSSRVNTLPKDVVPFPIAPIELDGQLHSDFRKLIAPYFTPASIDNLGQKARQLANQLIDSFIDDGGCDFSAQFAFQMPIGIFMSLASLPDEDRLELLELADLIVRPPSLEARTTAYMDMFAYLRRTLEARKANPGDDMLSALVKGRVDGGRPLTQIEMEAMGLNLVAAGLDTVAGMMGYIMLHLATHPEHRRRLIAEPDILPAAVEELMRRHGIANMARVCTRDLTFRGHSFRKGDVVMASTSVAGIDDRRYDRPYTVDFDRADKKSLVFGRGPHACIGAFLARTEIRVLITEWLRRIPDFSIAPGKQPVMATGSSSVVHHLPLVWRI